jgi:hypothetical protein
MVDAIAGNRSMRSNALHALMDQVGMDLMWKLRLDIPHFFKLSADVTPILPVIERLREPLLWWIPPVLSPEQLDVDHQALKTYFVIRSADGHILVIDRDPWRIGKGKQALIAACDALPFSPAHIKGLRWAGGNAEASMLDLPSRKMTLLMDIFKQDEGVPDINGLSHMLFNDASTADRVTWDDVIAFALASNISPAEVLSILNTSPRISHA